MMLQRLATGATGVKQARYRRRPTRGRACGDGFVESEVLLLEEVLNSVSVQEAFDDLVTDVLLSAVIRAELAGLGQLAEAGQEVIESFTRLLCAAAKGPSLY